METEQFDVLIVGAGLSGIGAGYHLQTGCPKKSYVILEGRAELGGTWSLFKYPGLRSDSDMFTLGYSFRPWKQAKAIADGASILEYVRETARELGIDSHIRFNHRVVSASWSPAEARWTVEVLQGPEKTPARYQCKFLYGCSGYYNYERGYTPDFPGRETFLGPVIHPQQWPEELDYSGKRVVIIGSGATAVTLVPSMAERAAHVTMLQRSPSYIMSLPAQDVVADFLRKVLPAGLAHGLIRSKNVLLAIFFYQLSRRAPSLAKRLLRAGVARELPKDFDLDKHFKPAYQPWDQRVCFAPDADLFKSIASGRASVETERIRSFKPEGIELESGEILPADIIVTATGLDLMAMGGVKLTVDGRDVQLSESFVYKGLMLADVPNFAFCVGYTNASWTLRADLSSRFVCRVLNRMDDLGAQSCTPRLPGPMEAQPILDLKSGYVQRAMGRFPKQGTQAPWILRQNYLLDAIDMKLGSVDDGTLEFEPEIKKRKAL